MNVNSASCYPYCGRILGGCSTQLIHSKVVEGFRAPHILACLTCSRMGSSI